MQLAATSSKRGLLTFVAALALLVLVPCAVEADAFPSVPVATLGGTPLMLPGALRASNALLVIGFTQRSEKQTVVWRKRTQQELGGDPGLTVYPVIVIAGIPRIFRGLVIAGIRAGYPRTAWNHFLVVSDHEDRWKTAVDWQGPDRAYLLLLDRTGKVVWRRSGPFTASGEQSLAETVSTLTASSP